VLFDGLGFTVMYPLLFHYSLMEMIFSFQLRPELLGLCAFFVSIVFVYLLVFITVIVF